MDALPSDAAHCKNYYKPIMDDEARGESMATTGPTFIKKRTKPRGSAPVSNASSRTSILNSNENGEVGSGAAHGGKEVEEEDDDDDVVAVQRTAGIGARGRGLKDNKVKKQRAPVASALSFGNDGEEPAFQLKRSALAQANRKEAEAGSLPSSLDQANIGGIYNDYSASALAALKASTPGQRRVMEEDGDLDLAHQDMIDPTTQTDEHGNSLSRLKFGADFAHDGIPSEALVTAAKERRRRAAEGQHDDFISLRDYSEDQGPHPESRLQREEDDMGSGEEEFAEFTGATERVALGQKAIKEEKLRERRERREAMDLDEDSNDSGQEWERAQMGRIEGVMSRKQREKREKSPFRPAPIPMTAPLPTLTSTSARLASRVAALESSIKSHGQVIDDAVRQIEQLEGDEKRNKGDIEVAGDKEAWFRELEEFISSLSIFLDDKMPRLEEIEIDWRGVMVERAQMVEKARAIAMTDEACLFHGVPARNLLPKLTALPEDERMATDEEHEPIADGGALSVIRETRRTTAGQYEDSLPPADEAAFEAAQKDIQRRLRQLLDDVKAPEFLDPAIRINSRLHPSSLVVRFHQWRTLYPDEYANAWGGLTLAGIWDFWIRKELCDWDLPKSGHNSFDEFQWHKELTRFSAAGSKKEERGEDSIDSATAEAIGGDEEVISHVIANTFIPRVIDACKSGAFDPWSAKDTRSMTEILEQIGYVLERDNSRFQSLISAFLHIFESHIDTLIDAMSNPPAIAAPSFDPRAPPALLSFLGRIKVLFFNLFSLNRYVSASERPFYLDLIDRLVGKLMWNLLGSAKDTGGKEIAQEILTRCGRSNLLQGDVRARLTAMVT